MANGGPDASTDRPTREELKKLTGLVTFGSPLDKIYYFFREETKPDQAVRAQLLSFIHSFRKARSGRDYGEFAFKYSSPEEPGSAFPDLEPEFRWINVWSPADLVSGKLHFYRLSNDDQRQMAYWSPVSAHLAYWGDPAFYAFVVDRLIGGQTGPVRASDPRKPASSVQS